MMIIMKVSQQRIWQNDRLSRIHIWAMMVELMEGREEEEEPMILASWEPPFLAMTPFVRYDSRKEIKLSSFYHVCLLSVQLFAAWSCSLYETYCNNSGSYVLIDIIYDYSILFSQSSKQLDDIAIDIIINRQQQPITLYRTTRWICHQFNHKTLWNVPPTHQTKRSPVAVIMRSHHPLQLNTL